MLSALNIPEQKIKQLNREGIETLKDLLQFLPKKHKSRERLTGFVDAPEETVILVRAEQVKYISKAAIVKLIGRESSSGATVHILWFNQSYLYPKLTPLVGTEILVAGNAVPKEAQYGEPAHYEIVAPAVFDERGAAGLGIYPTYRKIPGMNEEYLKGCISKAAYLLGKPQETIPEQIVMKRNLLGYGDMIGEMHWPTSQENLQKAYDRKLWEDLLYFALRIEMNYRGTAQGSPFNLPSVRTATDIINNLPYQLTADQESTYAEMLRMIRSGKRLNALVQGDVGCGKTILAFLLMVAFAENGCQAVLMAPTQILAEQHYEALSALVAPYGLHVAFVSGRKLRKPLQLELEEKIASGEYSLIVGTQARLPSRHPLPATTLPLLTEFRNRMCHPLFLPAMHKLTPLNISAKRSTRSMVRIKLWILTPGWSWQTSRILRIFTVAAVPVMQSTLLSTLLCVIIHGEQETTLLL